MLYRDRNSDYSSPHGHCTSVPLIDRAYSMFHNWRGLVKHRMNIVTKNRALYHGLTSCVVRKHVLGVCSASQNNNYK